MTRFVYAVTIVALVGAAAGQAQEKDKPDPTGTWKWTVMGQNNQSREMTLKLKLEGDKLTGAMVGRNGQETAIEEASFKDGQVAFSVTRERNGEKTKTKYSAKLDGDTLKGKSERDGAQRSRDWEAKRAKAT